MLTTEEVNERKAHRRATVALLIACIAPAIGLALLDHDHASASFFLMMVGDVSVLLVAADAKRMSAIQATRDRAQNAIILAVLGLIFTLFAAMVDLAMSNVVVH